jgi:hypothetical protein
VQAGLITPEVAKELLMAATSVTGVGQKAPHHYQLRDKKTKKWLTMADVQPDCDDSKDDEVVVVLQAEKAHNLRYQYERQFESYGIEVEIEVVALDAAGKEVSVE